MPSVLLTAFKPYDHWDSNASWLAVMELTKEIPSEVELTTRLYPVDYVAMRKQLDGDLNDSYDFALHVGQAPGSAAIRLEAIGLNARGTVRNEQSMLPPLEADGPVAVQTDLPLAAWANMLREEKIPAEVSYHAGTYLCNAALYYSIFLAKQKKLNTRSAFIHVPIDVSQAANSSGTVASAPTASLPAALSAQALRIILNQLLLV